MSKVIVTRGGCHLNVKLIMTQIMSIGVPQTRPDVFKRIRQRDMGRMGY